MLRVKARRGPDGGGARRSAGVYEPVRGGLRVIVGSDGSMMAAGSTLTTGQATELSEAGSRTELENFDVLRQRDQTHHAANVEGGR